METETVGKVLTEAKIENIKDLWAVEQGLRPADQARSITVPDALVDTGAFLLSLPSTIIGQLGLQRTGTRRVRSSLGTGEAAMFEAVRLTIRGRDCTQDVMEVPDGTPILIGRLPLDRLDYVVDPVGQKLIGNPRHGGDYIVEMH